MKTFLNTILIFFIFSITCIKNLNAQGFEVSILAGMSASQIDGDTQNGYKKPGFMAGACVQTNLNHSLCAKSELFYIGKGATMKMNGIEEYNTTLHYIEMPVMLGYKPIERFETDFGFAASYLFHKKYESYGEIIMDGLNDMHNFDFSAILSVIYFFDSKIGCNVKVNYSFLPIKNHPNWFNNTICLALVYKLK
jgi:hypothetical protein